MTPYKDNFKGPDVTYERYFPKIDPIEVLSSRIRNISYSVLDFRYRDSFPLVKELALAARDKRTVPEDSIGRYVAHWFFDFYGTPQYIEDELSKIEGLENKEEHHISEENKNIIKELQRLPKEIRDYCLDSAKTHNIPARLLVESIISAYIRDYDIGFGLDTIRWRGGFLGKVIGNFLDYILPDKVKEKKLGEKWNDFLGGVVIDGKAATGITQMRPAWVIRYQGWKRFGIDATKFSGRRISWMLLNPKYNIEATAKMWRSLIDETKKYRKEAIRYNKDPDMSIYSKESITDRKMKPHPVATAEYFKLLPDPTIFGKEDWLIAVYHPMYFEWSNSRLKWHKLIIQSGILDGKAIEPVDIQVGAIGVLIGAKALLNNI